MARIPPEQLPQPIYPQPAGQPAAGQPAAGQPPPSPAPAPAPAPAAGAPAPVPGMPAAGGPKKRPRTALIAGIAGAAVVVIAVVVVLVLTLGGEKKAGPSSTAASQPNTSSSNSGGSGNAKAAASLMLGEVSMPPSESQCVVDAFEQDSALADAVVANTANTQEVADLLAGCVSSGTVADAIAKGLTGQYPADSIECLRSNLALLDQATLSQLLAAYMGGDLQSAQSIVSYAAAGC